MKLLTWIIVLLVISFIGYNIWAGTGKDYSVLSQNRDITIEVVSQGSDRGKGNIIGFQPYFSPVDYCDETHFRAALHPFFLKAQSEGLLQPRTIVVLPENTGTWLALSNEKTTVYQSDSLIHAIAIVVNTNIFSYLPKLFVTRKADLISYAFFDMKARPMADAYQRVFSSLAKEFKVSIVAGSIVLPEPSVNKDGNIKLKRGNLCNAAFVFGPDGNILQQPVKKTNLSGKEKKFISPVKINDKKVLETPAGDLAVLVGADGGLAGSYTDLQANILAIPSFNGTDSTAVLINQRIHDAVKSGIHDGIAVFYSGRLWEMNLEGTALSLHKDSVHVYAPTLKKGRMINVWF